MKVKYFLLMCICFALVSCKLLVCAAKTEKYLPEASTQEESVDTIKAIFTGIFYADAIDNPKEAITGGVTTVYKSGVVLPNWTIKGDTIIATIRRSGEEVAAIPGYPIKLTNIENVYLIFRDDKGFFIGKPKEERTEANIINEFSPK